MRPSFDPATGSVELGTSPTPYALAHERAHQMQQERRTCAWRSLERWRGIPLAERVANLWVEWEASRLALAALERLGRCDRWARIEAREGLWSYIWSLVG